VAYDKNLDRIYSDRTYVSTTMVRHAGTTVAFAMDANRRIFYSVLNLELEEATRGPLDVAYWNAEPGLLTFPGEIVEVMPPVTTSIVLPAVERGTRAETQPDLLTNDEIDQFLSTTARLTALARLQVVSDGRYIYVFRQSIAATDGDAVFQLTGGGWSGDPSRADYKLATTAGQPKIAAVDNSLLCDRYVLGGSLLLPVVEVRYQRSRSKFAPASGGDTMGTRDMQGKLFYEPTVKLSFVSNLTGGAFCATQLPTAVSGQARWQVFAFNSATNQVESFNVPADSDGLFSVTGQQLYTSPDQKYQASVLERSPGIDFNTKQPLIPVPPSTDRAGTALHFDGSAGTLTVAPYVRGDLPGGSQCTLEAWIKPAALGGQIIAIGGGFGLYLYGDGMLAAGKDRWELKATTAVPTGVYSHVAAVYNGSNLTLFVNGASVASSTSSPAIPILSTSVTIGAGFNGDIDEVRLWASARTRFDDRWRRLTGIEPNLCVYLRMDEGAGATASDSTRWLRQVTLSANPGPTWVSSDAPVGDGPGMSRDSFAITGYSAATPLATTMYFQQEPEATPGYDDQPEQLKRQSRLLLAFGIVTQAQPGQAQSAQPQSAQHTNLCTLDFAVTRYGRLAQLPAQLQLASIAAPAPTTDQQAISAAQTVLANAQAALNADQALVNRIPDTLKQIQDLQGSWMLSKVVVDLNRIFPDVRRGYIQQENQARANLANLQNQLSQLEAAQTRLATDQAAVKAAQDKLATLTAGQSGGDEVSLPMPLVSTDRTGLSAYGGTLGFAWTVDAPTLLESSTGDVVLYFRGSDGQFFAAYYATKVSRAVKTITIGTDKLSLIARDISANLSDITVTVSDVASSADQCQVQITRGSVTETFGQVPRAAATLANVLNGTLPPGPLAGTALSVDDQVIPGQPVTNQTVKLAGSLANALTSGTGITIGGITRRLSADAAAGATTLTIASDARSYAYPKGGEVRTVIYDYGQRATCTVVGASLARGSLIVGVRAGTITASVPSGTATDGTAALVPRWRGDSPGRALNFDGNAQCLRLSPATTLPAIAPTGNLTIEAWANPAYVGPGITQGGRARIVHANVPAPPAGSPPNAQVTSYTLGMEGAPLNSALAFDGTSSLTVSNPPPLAATDFTIEMWVKRQAGGQNTALYGHSGANNVTMGIGFGPDQFSLVVLNAANPQQVATSSSYADTGWHHWATTYVAASGQVTIYRDGAQVAQGTLTNAPQLAIGGSVTLAGSAAVALDEVRVWRRARTAQAIAAYMNTRASGEEPGLLAYWSFQNGSTIDRTGNHYDAVMNGTPQQVTSGLPGAYLVAGVGNQFVRSADTFPVGQWGHVALVFRQDWAMKLNGTSYLDAGGADGLNLLEDMTIEAFVRLDTLGVKHGLVSKGAIASGQPRSAVPFAFYVQEDGRLVFTFESGSGGPSSRQTFISGVSAAALAAGSANLQPVTLQAGTFAKVAVTRVRVPNDPTERYNITFYVNGTALVSGPNTQFTGAKPVGNDQNCEIGRYSMGATGFGLVGILSDVRIWNVARSVSQIGAPITTKAQGLVAWWNFPEDRGASTADEMGNYPAVVRGATRVRTPDPAGSSFTLYRNGAVASSALVAANDPLAIAGYGSNNQFTVAGNSNADGSLAEGFAGVLDEIRIWRVARTQEQILDNLFCRLRGERQDLLGYYPFDSASTVLSATVNDLGLRANSLTPSSSAPTIQVSTAPVSDDTAQVRSALTTVLTPFNALVGGTPTGSEYADAQRDSQGGLIGVMKRCYAYVRAGSWVLRTGYKVGDLVTSWVGQAQFNPQLIGYIEGAPPMPSENLIYDSGADYNDKSSVTFVQADKISSTLGQTKEGTFDFAAKMNFKFGFSDETYIVAAPVGAGTAKPAAKVKGSVDAGFELKFSQGWSEDTQVHQETSTTRTSAVSLTGHFEEADAAKQVNPTAGRRFVPANYGFAIVQSATADLYALRLGHSGALVTYRMVANPDIPPDWNIITFQINPAYCKQGTLDGLVGYAAKGSGGALQPFADPDYPKAADTDIGKGEFSYYRPSEAYALKRRIQREELQLQSFYDSVSTDTTLLGNNKVYEQAERALNAMTGGGGGPGTSLDPATGNAVAGREANRSSSKRNLADTYVWTASGGLFSETTSTTDQVTWVTTGNYSVSGSTTIGGSIDIDAGPVSIGISGEASFGGSSTITRTKTRDASRGFSLSVVCQPSRNLLDANNQPVPGRVDAYRFISFYLDTTIDNYDDFYGKVIDPVWLASSSDPGAIALRQSRQPGRKPPCWRIFHRVTFVSRVLPTPPSTATPTLQTAMSALNMASNNAMVLQIKPYLGNPAPATLDALTTAATTAISTHFPALAAYTADIVNTLAAYYTLT
jgi:hypothetical protein